MWFHLELFSQAWGWKLTQRAPTSKQGPALSTTLYPVSEGFESSDLHLSSSDFDGGKEESFDAQLEGTWSLSAIKRGFDLVLSGTALVSLIPVLAGIALAIRLTSPGPAFFRQRRTGRGQKPFTIYKFRTMHIQAEQNGPSVTRAGDERMTQIGCWLRKLKFDELPQLYNIVRGDMSFVGPRPKAIGHERMNLVCRPGITGVATLLFSREEDLLLEVPEAHAESFAINVLNPIKAQLDMRYVENGTFGSDIKIIAKTALRLGRKQAVTTIPELTEALGDYESGVTADFIESVMMRNVSEEVLNKVLKQACMQISN
jgi:lipopolysaccharide/colanic/teichoic acid biosynthesis glycosyltransferase